MLTHQESSASPPGESPPEELPPFDGEAADEDADEGDPAVAAPSRAAAVRVVERLPLPRRGRSLSCSPTPSESRTTVRGDARRTVGFTGSVGGASADGSEAPAAVGPVDVSSASAGSATCFVDVAVSVCVSWLPVAVCIDATSSRKQVIGYSRVNLWARYRRVDCRFSGCTHRLRWRAVRLKDPNER